VQRNARGVRLTEAGEALVRHADAVLARLAEAEAELEAIAGLKGGRLRMAAFESAGATLMPLAIKEFRAKHPAIELTMTLGEPEEAEPQLKSGELDLVIGFGSRYAQEDGVERHFLLEDPMFLVLPREHPLVGKRNLRLADLADEAWIGGPQDCECNRLIYGACSAAGYDPRIAFETDDYAAVQGFVAAGVGVSLIAELGLTTIRDDIVVRDLGRETPVRKIYAATSGGYRTPATAAMLEVLDSVTAGYESRRPRLALVS
jgi:DNA-binding transcriptional LysR family regulator